MIMNRGLNGTMTSQINNSIHKVRIHKLSVSLLLLSNEQQKKGSLCDKLFTFFLYLKPKYQTILPNI